MQFVKLLFRRRGWKEEVEVTGGGGGGGGGTGRGERRNGHSSAVERPLLEASFECETV